MTTDAAFGMQSDRQLKLQSRVAPSYQFVFGYRSTNTSDGIYEDTEWAGQLRLFKWFCITNIMENVMAFKHSTCISV